MRRGLKAILVLLMIASALYLSGCGSGNPTKNNATNSSDKGTLSIRLIIPNYDHHGLGSSLTAKTIDPQTSRIQVLMPGNYGDVVVLDEDIHSYGTLTPYLNGMASEWSGSIAVFPQSTPVDITVKLSDASGNALTHGTAKDVLIPAGQTTEVSIGCLPITFTPVKTDGSQTSDTVNAGQMKYYRFYAIKDGVYDITITPTTGSPDLYLFDPTGRMVNGIYSGGTSQTLNYTATANGSYYLGVYAYQQATNFNFSINATLPAPLGNHLLINELSFNDTAIEIYNPTNTEKDLNGWQLMIWYPYLNDYSTINISSSFIIPPRAMGVIFNWDSDQFTYATIKYITSFYLDSSQPGAVALIDPVGNNGVDAVLFNTNSLNPPAGTNWSSFWDSSQIDVSGKTLARKVKAPLDTNSANDWENSYSTLGLPNDTSGNANVPIDVH